MAGTTVDLEDFDLADTRVDLGGIDFADVARAYKIMFFHSCGKSKALRLFFDTDGDNEAGGGEYEGFLDEDAVTDPVTEARYRQWLAANSGRIELDLALRMLFEEMLRAVEKKDLIHNIVEPHGSLENARERTG